MSVDELDLQSGDELIRFGAPAEYRLEAQKLERAVLVQGVVQVKVECDCARCLKTFPKWLTLSPWTLHLPLTGPEAVAVQNDCVDLTPHVREDILLALPQHPLCSSECEGLLREYAGGTKSFPGNGSGEDHTSPWSDLEKLDL